MRADRSGAALVASVLLSLASLLLAHAALVLAQAELRAAQSSVRAVRLEFLAERGALAVIERIRSAPDSVDSSVAGDSVGGVDGAAEWRGRIRRISAEIWLAEGEATEARARRAVALAVWRLDPATRTRAFAAAVETGGTSIVEGLSGVTIQIAGGASIPPVADDCPTGTGSAESWVPWMPDPDSSTIALGLLALDSLTARAGRRVSTGGTPAPEVRLGECVHNPWNWGDPEGRHRPCGQTAPVVDVAPGVVVDRGLGQGVLVARGDLTLRGTTYYGVILAEGIVRLEGAASVTGVVVARGGVAVSPEARVLGSPCWAAAVLGDPALRFATPIAPMRWIRLDG